MKKLLPLSCLMATMFLASCSSVAPYAALPIENDAEQVSNVVVTNAELRSKLRVGRAGVRRVDGSNQLKVIVPIRNVSENQLQIRIQVSFLDLEKAPIGDDTNSQVQIIGPGETHNHSVTSTMSEARDWVMRIVPNY
ncbi:MAG: putative lipoprotein YajG [Hyphomicrobiaceae bacterium]|jgi:uncharacterized lipoprotein YajG